MKLHIICVAYRRVLPLEILIDSFLVQTNPNWTLNIIHDGEISADTNKMLSYKNDDRITVFHTNMVYGKWGHPNRDRALSSLQADSNDFVLITNDDNYYVPRFVGQFLESINPNIGMVYCNAIHNYTDYGVHDTQIREGWIDIGSFAVRVDIAKEVGFKHRHVSADGTYAEECFSKLSGMGLKAHHIKKYIFIHN